MSTRARRKKRRLVRISKTAAFRLTWLGSHAPASDEDRQTLIVAKQWFERQWRWSRTSTFFGVVLGTAAIVVALVLAEPFFRWPLLVAGVLDLILMPCYTWLACRRYWRMIALISLDLEYGVVGLGEGRVQRRFGIWRSVYDFGTHRARTVLPACFKARSPRPGAVVAYRYALRSALILGIQPSASPNCSGPAADAAHF